MEINSMVYYQKVEYASMKGKNAHYQVMGGSEFVSKGPLIR